MSRVGAWFLVGLAIGGCNDRPLGHTAGAPSDGAVVDAVSRPEIDGPLEPPPVADARPADAPADVRVDAPLPDAHVTPTTDAGADTTPPADAGMDTAADSDATPPPDGPCSSAGNGRVPQAGPLFGTIVTARIPDGLGPGGANATAIGIGDVTGDGRADVVVGSYHPAIVVYPQMADGRLGSPVKYPIAPGLAGHPGLLDVGDLDGDGHLDVVFPRQDGIGILRGRAAGGFEPEQVLPPPPGATAGSNPAIADLDGDGRQDLVAMPYSSDGVEVRLQNAAGALVSTGMFHCPGALYGRMAIGDTDADGRADIVLGVFGGALCLLRQRPGGGFGFDDGVAVAVNGDVNGVAVGNFGAVGCGPAIAFALYGNRPRSQLGFFSRSASGVSTPLTLLGAYDLPEDMAAVDVDGDGHRDVVVMHIGWLKVGVFRALPTGGLAAEELYPFSYINHGADRLAVGDINGDGRPDIVSADFELSILYHAP